MKKLVMAFFVMCLCFPAYAHGANTSGPSREEALQIAERWIAAEGLVNPCVGKLTIRMHADPQVGGFRVRGFADGWRGQEWDPTLCDVTLREGMGAVEECEVLGHEYMHMVRGPDHTGPLAPESFGPAECRIEVKRSPRQLLHDTVRESLPKSLIWRVRCSKKHCVATSPQARYARRITFRFEAGGLMTGKWTVKQRRNNGRT